MFKLLNYIQPTHYFNLYRKDGSKIYPKLNSLDDQDLSKEALTTHCQSATAKDYERSVRWLHRGYIGKVETYKHTEAIPLEDEYRFLRSQVHPYWVYYCFVCRFIALHNPIKEIVALWKSRGVKKDASHIPMVSYTNFETFESALVQNQPLVSIIIPTLNRYPYLKDVLQDVQAQEYTNIEVIVVDQSDPYEPEFYDAFAIKLQLIRQEEKALWLARNTAIAQAKGDYLLFFDDDSRVAPDWVRQHLKALDYFDADISSGVSISKIGAPTPKSYDYFRVSDQLDTGNALITRSVFKQIGLFDRQFEGQRMGDGEFGCRAFVYGFRNVSNPLAKRLHLKVATGGLRTMGAWDAFRTTNLWQPRPIPSVLYYFRRYYGTKRSILALVKTIPASVMPYRFKGHRGLTLLGVVALLVLWPFIFIQVIRSWHWASKKLQQGPLIATLHS